MPVKLDREGKDKKCPKRIVKVWLPHDVAAKLEQKGQPIGMGLSGVIRALCMQHVQEKP